MKESPKSEAQNPASSRPWLSTLNFRHRTLDHRAAKVSFQFLSSFVLLLVWSRGEIADQRGERLIDAYLNQSDRQDAVFTMVADYREGAKPPARLEFTWMRKVNQGLMAHLIRMDAPESEKGKMLLVREKSDGSVDYLAYRPNSILKKKVRISGARAYRYKGLSISVQELIGGELRQYRHSYAGSVLLDGVSCERVENVLKPEFRSESNFPRSVLFLRRDNGMPLRWELFGKSGGLGKTVYVEDLRKVEGVWTLARVRVEEKGKNAELRLHLKDGKYHPVLEDSIFTEEYLLRSSK